MLRDSIWGGIAGIVALLSLILYVYVERERIVKFTRPSSARIFQELANQDNVTVPTSNWTLWVSWVGVSILGVGLGISANMLIYQISGTFDEFFYMAIYGLMFGMGQWLVIRKYILFSAWWISLSMVVLVVGYSMTYDVVDDGTVLIFSWLIVSLVLGAIIIRKSEIVRE